VRVFLKRSGELGTVWWNKYRDDPFFRTEVNVVLLQIAFALVILGLVGTSFGLLYHEVSTAIVEGISASLTSDAPTSMGPTIVREIQQIRTQNLLEIALLIGITTILFGYIIARITLAPTRNALTSQKQFIGNVAHELRTPLSVIKTNTEVAMLDPKIPRDLRDILTSNVEELDRISSIINNLLTLSALVRPDQMRFASVDLTALVSDVLRKYGALIERGKYKVVVRTHPDVRAWGNTTALTQIVENLVRNALAYTPKGGRVTVSINSAQNSEVTLLIQDTGIGIAQKDLFRIFEPFYRAESSRTKVPGFGSKTSGSGLGLTIVSELVKLHYGKISIKSDIGAGTAVSVLLPSAPHRHTSASEQSEVVIDFSSR
jgi:signal transduction histidine kinase